jgi:aspartyl-tRNA(Asn)/glutamyl-tRNA(Gln) amidotransferase subunit A
LPAFPPAIEEVFVRLGNLREHVVDAFTRLNILCDLTGLPAISVPCGFGANGLPIGPQIIGKAFDESTVLRVGHADQSMTDWHGKTPTGIMG